MYLPVKIKKIVENKDYIKDTLGESGSIIFLYSDMVLKVSRLTKENVLEIENLKKFSNILPIPRIIYSKITKRKVYLLMSKIDGKPILEYPINTAIDLACEALKILWSVKIPNNLLDYRDALEYIETNVIEDYQGLIDSASKNTYSNRFKNPYELLSWLKNNYPKESKTVLSHGDFFLPNILADGTKITGIIDLGFMGLFPKERDIASLIKSFTYNYSINTADIMELMKNKLEYDDTLVNYFLLYDELI